MSKWYTEEPMGSGNLVLVWDGVGPIPADFGTRCDLENPGRIVAKYASSMGDVSTVLLYLDHGYDLTESAAPLVYETMVFGGVHDGDQKRYATRKEAEAGHARMVAFIGGPT